MSLENVGWHEIVGGLLVRDSLDFSWGFVSVEREWEREDNKFETKVIFYLFGWEEK